MTEAHAALQPSVAGPLSHLRVLEIAEEIPGPFAGRLLHDLGAAVTKVERPGSGDCSRQAGPFRDDEPDPEASGLYTYFNRGKRSVTLDWTQPDGARPAGTAARRDRRADRRRALRREP